MKINIYTKKLAKKSDILRVFVICIQARHTALDASWLQSFTHSGGIINILTNQSVNGDRLCLIILLFSCCTNERKKCLVCKNCLPPCLHRGACRSRGEHLSPGHKETLLQRVLSYLELESQHWVLSGQVATSIQDTQLARHRASAARSAIITVCLFPLHRPGTAPWGREKAPPATASRRAPVSCHQIKAKSLVVFIKQDDVTAHYTPPH